MSDRTELLKRVPLFSDLERRELEEIASSMKERTFRAGDTIATEGQTGIGFFVIEEGEAAVVSGGKHLTDLCPGDFLGEIGLLRQHDRTASVIAATPVTALVMDAETFRQMAQSMPAISRQLDAAIEERLARDRLFGLNRAAPR